MGTRIGCIGECMVELSAIDLEGGTCRIGFAGDTLNTATCLVRLLPSAAFTVSYVTNLGLDTFSSAMLAQMRAEGIDTGRIGRHPDRQPGIYSIERRADGERSFSYWRGASAARTLFSGVGIGLPELGDFQVIYLSGITLAILPAEVRNDLILQLGALRASGVQVVFDSNYRPRLWDSAETAREAFDAMWRATSLALPSFDDEVALYPGATPEEAARRIAGLGVPEVVLKNGAAGPLILADGTIDRPDLPQAGAVVDTSGAGDAFNAGYLAARLLGRPVPAAAVAGHELASRVIGFHGAILPKGLMP